MIVNRFDYQTVPDGGSFGVGFDLLETSSFSSKEVDLALSMLELRRRYFGDGVVAVDCGANIGVHTIEWARAMTGWGEVIAIEAQERVFYALAGNIALNNCFNARAMLAAVGDKTGSIRMPVLDHTRPASFGSVELTRKDTTEFVGQAVDYSEQATKELPYLTLDSLGLRRADLIKIDIEGMEKEALTGAKGILRRCRPIVVAEFIKSDKVALRSFLEGFDYKVFELRMDLVAIHRDDRSLDHVRP
ncbi:FkbM family methyltransferase [Bradyrhizobium tropiciagri]|nr:FkbM family methyltransferase [Bradyrhizobium tropiciagri]MBR0899189.1 FkbM family methyltransferase [Bradyrhizobium tropiciagri]